ncbi:hypothetical protein SEA_TIERRA_15 [Mycobacterium phage Tierra]|uniref:Head-to-tail connector protein n=2 Tax=Unicornvirus TaxID=2948939 RepID=A0A222ZJZ9_9CAUD|nr:neck protein [Mycobacterium phage Unicorn]YP_009951294.1 neck protein [Mycobacterium phage Bryler]ASR85127.1 hypothetical protein SEA_PHELPSODU_15 [Mycobacterium phage PhelpsODU]ASR85314.1 hypothetical protein SEA_PHRANK_15 [Mycobacterium phage Phrank]ASR85415.1 hypothetical protein SEA_CAIN_15 [Mycobacterium phage Cain]WNM68304.1 hypothetical protein SEA_TIERRA_15 [Mycobacterium phage Tierra]ASR85027.1 hypothetical protein SEA_UNICORN_15 [Mycobacterium phage Unicorn]
MPYRPLDMPYSEHNMIRTMPGVIAECERIGAELRDQAAAIADSQTEIDGAGEGYETETRVGRDRVRVYVRAESGEAVAAEQDVAPLMQVSAGLGP